MLCSVIDIVFGASSQPSFRYRDWMGTLASAHAKAVPSRIKRELAKWFSNQ